MDTHNVNSKPISGINYNSTLDIKTNNDNNTMEFGWDSKIKDEQMKFYQNNTDRQINILNETLKTNITEVRDQFGALIINASASNMWFSKNVAFIFGIGSIYDEEDEILMNGVLSYFDNTRDSGFFMNHYRIESYYDSALIQEIEKKLKIANGNYHVFMVPVVYAEDDELKNAPEPQFNKKGIVKKFMKWTSITDYMREIMAKYGLITELERQHEPYSWEIGQEGLSTRIGLKDDVECKFDIDVDPDGRIMMEIEKNLDFQRDLHDNYNNRIREGKAARDGTFNVNTQTRSKRKTLYQQMYEHKMDAIPPDSIPDQHDGVALKLNERYMPQTKNITEYQLYEDNSTFVDGKNVINNDNIEMRENIPRFMQTAVRGSKARNPAMGGHMSYIKSMK